MMSDLIVEARRRGAVDGARQAYTDLGNGEYVIVEDRPRRAIYRVSDLVDDVELPVLVHEYVDAYRSAYSARWAAACAENLTRLPVYAYGEGGQILAVIPQSRTDVTVTDAGEVIGLPDPRPGTRYLVEESVRVASRRGDLVVPQGHVRDTVGPPCYRWQPAESHRVVVWTVATTDRPDDHALDGLVEVAAWERYSGEGVHATPGAPVDAYWRHDGQERRPPAGWRRIAGSHGVAVYAAPDVEVTHASIPYYGD